MHLDTHVVAWLYAGDLDRFPARVRERLEVEILAISPIVALELQYLHEVERIDQPQHVVVEDLRQRVGLRIVDASFETIATAAAQLAWTRDPFDRLIVAHALTEGTVLLTADRSIRDNLDLAVWD